jgi:hypothetical protein
MQNNSFKNLDTFDLKSFLLILNNSKKLIIILTLIFVVCSCIYSLTKKPHYNSLSTIELNTTSYGVFNKHLDLYSYKFPNIKIDLVGQDLLIINSTGNSAIKSESSIENLSTYMNSHIKEAIVETNNLLEHLAELQEINKSSIQLNDKIFIAQKDQKNLKEFTFNRDVSSSKSNPRVFPIILSGLLAGLILSIFIVLTKHAILSEND